MGKPTSAFSQTSRPQASFGCHACASEACLIRGGESPLAQESVGESQAFQDSQTLCTSLPNPCPPPPPPPARGMHRFPVSRCHTWLCRICPAVPVAGPIGCPVAGRRRCGGRGVLNVGSLQKFRKAIGDREKAKLGLLEVRIFASVVIAPGDALSGSYRSVPADANGSSRPSTTSEDSQLMLFEGWNQRCCWLVCHSELRGCA